MQILKGPYRDPSHSDIHQNPPTRIGLEIPLFGYYTSQKELPS